MNNELAQEKNPKYEVIGQSATYLVYNKVPGLAPLLAEYDGNGNLVAKYHHDGEGLLAMTRNNQSYWYGFEGIGTVRQLMGSQGQVVDAYAFDAWGNELTSPQSPIPNPFKYVGKHGYYLDTESALMLLGVRYYGAEISRFISLDPIQSERNWYVYTSNNPVGAVDPVGLMVWRPPRPPCPVPRPPCPRPRPPEPGPPGDGNGNPPGNGEQNPICGYDITVQLIFAMERVRTEWRRWSIQDKFKQCHCIYSPSQYSGAWDIEELAKAKGFDGAGPCTSKNKKTPPPEGLVPADWQTVTVRESCHRAVSVNYILFGQIFRLCSIVNPVLFSYSKMIDLILLWKCTQYGCKFAGEATAWATTGWNYPPLQPPPSPAPIVGRGCTPNPNKYTKPFTIYWCGKNIP